MPRVEFGIIDWDAGSITYATRRGISIAEIEDVIRSERDWTVNKKARAGNVMTTGRTRGGRLITVIALWNPHTRVIRPINAWEAK